MKLKASAFVLASAVLLGSLPAVPVQAAGTDLYVGSTGGANSYSTVQEAVNAAAALNPKSEQDRVTIHIAPGTYREQVTVNTPYLSFVNDRADAPVTLTWYYGIGYKYYSVSSDGVYSADAARAKNAKNEPTQRWGCSVRIRSGAKYFRAENITFENSFNRYVTDEELADGVEVSGSQSITFARQKGADVQSKAATERAAAIAIEGDYAEFKSCAFQSSQDTLFLGSSFGYFRDCLIEGNTDYIFGSGTYVFDSCELRFKGYSSSAAGGYITANKDAGRTLFTNCSVTAASGLTVNAGYFGRPWGASADIAFVNTKLQYEGIITSAGWTKMSGNAPENAKFKEYGTTAGGKQVNTSGRVSGTVQSSANGLDTETYLGSWTPFYLSGGTLVEIQPVSGTLVQELTPAQPGYAWSIHENTQNGDSIFTDRDFVFRVYPERLAGGEAILTPCDGKKLSGTLAEFQSGAEITVSVLLDTRVEQVPAWMQGYEKTGEQAESSNDVIFDVYSKNYAAGAHIALGENGQSANCVNYAVIITRVPAETTAPETTEPPAETTLPEEPPAQQTLAGDTDCSGILNAADLSLLKQHLLQNAELTGSVLANADVNGDGSTDLNDAASLRDWLLGR